MGRCVRILAARHPSHPCPLEQVELNYDAKVVAVRLRLLASQTSWLMIREVAVWT